MGDTQYWRLIFALAGAQIPAISINRKGDKPKDWQIKIRDFGQDLLEEKTDWLKQNSIQRWVGGVQIDSGGKSANWRYDPESGKVLEL